MYYNDKTLIFFNGTFVKANETLIDLYSQTMHYGYGVFEGIRAYQTAEGARIFKAKEHYERLVKSCQLIKIPLNYSVEELIEASYAVLEQNNLQDAYIRPLVYCGSNMALTKPTTVSVMIAAWEWGAYLGEKQLRLKLSSFCRPHPRSIQIEAKVCGHYINSILATNEAKDAGYDEALLLDSDGYLAEGPGANFFLEKDGKLFTPKLGNILPGITRNTVLELSENLGIKVEQGDYSLADLWSADAAFYCGTAAELVGIASVDDNVFPKNWENSLGKVLHEAYKKLVRKPQKN
ncbi:MAG: branched-chain amino acid transaminase [Thermonemataceae bacterium]|nr:branched-chain amino acid transaminase [Thermonemataceae bacterium]